MSKIHYFRNNYFKKPSTGAFHPQRLLTFNTGNQKFLDLTLLWFFKLIITKSNLKNSHYVISVMLSPLRHQNNVTNFFQFAPLNQNFWLRQCNQAHYKRTLHQVPCVKSEDLFLQKHPFSEKFLSI